MTAKKDLYPEHVSLPPAHYIGEVGDVVRFDHAVLSTFTTSSRREGDDACHFHENPLISFALSGESDERVGRRQSMRIAGQITFIPPGEVHQVSIRRFPSRVMSVEMDHEFLTNHNFDMASIERSCCTDATFCGQIFLKLFAELSYIGYDDSLCGASLHMLLLQAFGKEPSSNKMRPFWVNSLEMMIRDMWNEPLSLSDLSTAVGVHPVTISKSFPKYFGCTFGEYVRRLRIERSLDGVLRRNAALTDIALDSGFADQSHFTRTFKQLTGMLPTHLRSF